MMSWSGLSSRTVLVTGATGFLGRHTVRALLLAGHRVIAVGRQAGAAEGLNEWAVDEGFGVEPFPAFGGIALPVSRTAARLHVPGTSAPPSRSSKLGWAHLDLLDLGSIGVLARAVRHAHVAAIVHCAGGSNAWVSLDDARQRNLALARHVAMLTKIAGVPRLVHVSSADVGRTTHAQHQLDEHAPWTGPALDRQTASQRNAEQFLHRFFKTGPLAASSDHGIDGSGESTDTLFCDAGAFPVQAMIVRPASLVGPGERNDGTAVARWAHRWHHPLVNGGKALIELCAVENAAQALMVLATMDHDHVRDMMNDVPQTLGPALPIFHLSNGTPLRVRDVCDAVDLQQGVPAWRINVPGRWLERWGRWNEQVADWLDRVTMSTVRWTPSLDRRLAATLTLDHTLSIARARAWGYTPTIPLDDAFTRRRAWQAACAGQTVSEQVRLSMVYAADLPGEEENMGGKRFTSSLTSRLNVVPMVRRATTSETGNETLLVPPAVVLKKGYAYEPIDENEHARMYGFPLLDEVDDDDADTNNVLPFNGLR